MWQATWPQGPRTFEELRLWKIYCRVYDDVGCSAPGRWVVAWLRNANYTEDIYDDEYNQYIVEAIRWYTFECRE